MAAEDAPRSLPANRTKASSAIFSKEGELVMLACQEGKVAHTRVVCLVCLVWSIPVVRPFRQAIPFETKLPPTRTAQWLLLPALTRAPSSLTFTTDLPSTTISSLRRLKDLTISERGSLTVRNYPTHLDETLLHWAMHSLKFRMLR